MKTFFAAYVNLLKTSIGSGVLSFPYLFKTYGIVSTVFLTLLTGIMATTGLVLLTICSQGLGRNADLSKIAAQCFPYARIFVDLAVFLKCFGVSLSYVVITRQLLPPILTSVFETAETVNSKFISYPSISLLIFLGFIGPFAYFKKLDNLKYTSFLGISSIILVIFAAIFRYIKTDTSNVELLLFAPITINWITGMGKFIFSFTCHQNIFAVNSEIVDNSLPNMKKLIFSVSFSSFFLYMTFGMSNYMIYGSSVLENVLNSYPSDTLGTIVRGLYVIVMGVSYPLQMAPARTYLLNLVGITQQTKKYKIIHFLSTTILVMATYFIAISGVQLGLVYSIVGATASCFMCLIFPALFYFNLEIRKTVTLTIAAYLSFILGVFIFITTIIAMLYKSNK